MSAESDSPARDTAALYRRLVLLDRHQHRGFRAAPVADWRMARAINAVPLAAVEFAQAAHEMPIAFVPSAERNAAGQPQVLPIAMLGLREGENLFVGADGQWMGRYLPAVLRRYPFGMLRTGDDQLSLVVDEAWTGWTRSDDEAAGPLLIDPDGEPTAQAHELLAFLEHVEAEMQRTRALCNRLVELDLLRGAEVTGQLPAGGAVKADGFFMVDDQRLSALPDAEVLDLHRTGVLGLLHVHRHSMGHVQRLADRIVSHSG